MKGGVDVENLLTVISNDEFKNLIMNEKIIESEFSSQLSEQFKNDLIQYFKDLLEIEDVGCIMCLYKDNGNCVSLKKNYKDVGDYLEVTSECVMLQFQTDKSLMVTISFEEFLKINMNYANELQKGLDVNSKDLIAFVPFIKLKDSKYFIALDENWESVTIDVDEEKSKELRRMNIC